MMFTKTNVRSTTQITITFKPAVLSGILFYVARDEQSTTGDFLSIYLHNGLVFFIVIVIIIIINI